jgi:prepilin-type N-terminal cleavage/methylation domain-containing protein
MNAHKQSRGGYTLIELLVVIALISILAALTIAFFPNAASSARESRAAMQVQGWLNVAKQRALRDQAPRGLRLWVTSLSPAGPDWWLGTATYGNVVTDCQYIEQPDDFSGGQIVSAGYQPGPVPLAAPYTSLNTLFMSVDPTNGYGVSPALNNDPNRTYWSVQPGDYIEVLGSGLLRQIVQVGATDPSLLIVYPNYIVVSPPAAVPLFTATANYRIIRSPRVVGDEPLKMPDNTVIDLNTNAMFGNPTPQINLNSGSGFVDILFAPSGAVISPGVTTANINLWVRSPDPNLNSNFPNDFYRGAPSIISVFVQTGVVGAYDPVPGTPYALVY